MTKIYDINVTQIDGQVKTLKDYEDKYMVIVNTASKCGLVGQLEGLEEIYKEFKDKNVAVLGFPSNQFLNQEPLDSEGIEAFCQMNYNVTFPLFEKIKVNGRDAHPLYKYLIENTDNKKIKWNFTKFIVTPHEEKIISFAPKTSPETVKKELYALIDSKIGL
ncbi:glutathione peroxidase [Alkalibacterium sp. 20]|uniref:glutathione peroxidase n=1 Tax=Alkalibacterium sp. 20 TaxID=1798803 RepID=UPI0008FFE308|nr:glutathione peroxidase [Alkalibacterium sp. 20]OJF95360.1 glutathione peroxidase [Alkalibacterium sp. 20]